METDHFINTGYGWMCKRCHTHSEAPADELTLSKAQGRARFFHEGEAEDKEPALSTQALARWRDASRQTLFCPRCGVEERINKA